MTGSVQIAKTVLSVMILQMKIRCFSVIAVTEGKNKTAITNLNVLTKNKMD